jgi:hypothetical protein
MTASDQCVGADDQLALPPAIAWRAARGSRPTADEPFDATLSGPASARCGGSVVRQERVGAISAAWNRIDRARSQRA